MRNRLPLLLIGIVILAVLAGGAFFLLRPSQEAPAPTPTPKPVEQVNTIPLEERPYALIVPDPAKQGRGIILTIYPLKKLAAKGEYELEYQSGNLLQGAFGRIKPDELPDSYPVLLGSCSAGGKCSYHEDVTGGSLLLRLQDPEKYVLKNDWSFMENKEKETTLASRDSKFGLEGAGLARVSHLTVLNSPGLPAEVEQPLLSQVYSVGVISAPTGKFTVSIRLSEDVSAATILAWDGKAWVSLDTEVTDQVATAPAAKWFEAYVAVSASETAE